MRKPFDGDFPQTQGYNDPCCRNSYAQFGMKGHNGLDFGCPTGTRILAPHDGKVIEATLDPKGYGIYVKIENSIEGSVLAHLREFRVGVGDGVKEGDLIGYSDNSGNSTGAHLHWGYYRFPRDRQNGFAGFIDQTPYIGTGTPNLDQQRELDVCRIDRDANHNDRMALYEELGFTGVFNRTVAVEEIRKLKALEKTYVSKEESFKEAELKITELKNQISKLQDANTGLALEASVLTDRASDLEDKYKASTHNFEQAMDKIHELEQMLNKPQSKGWKKIIDGFFEIIGMR